MKGNKGKAKGNEKEGKGGKGRAEKQRARVIRDWTEGKKRKEKRKEL